LQFLAVRGNIPIVPSPPSLRPCSSYSVWPAGLADFLC